MPLDMRAQIVFSEFKNKLVANTIRKDPTMQYAAIPDAAAGWPIDDKVYTQFIDLVIKQNAFLQKINVVDGLDSLMGNILRYGITGHVLKMTNVSDTVKRGPTIVGNGAAQQYLLRPAEADAHFPYNDLNHWARLGPDKMAALIRNQIAEVLANDLLFVGFAGTSDGNPPANANLSDFAKGWLQLLRDYNGSSQLMPQVVAGSNRITVGPVKVVQLDSAAVVNVGGGVVGLPATAHKLPAGAQVVVSGTTNYNGPALVLSSSTANQINITKTYAAETLTASSKATCTPDYRSLDHLVADLKNNIPQELRTGCEVIVSDDLRSTDEEALYAQVGNTPSEKLAIQAALEKISNMPVNQLSLAPAGTVLVTPPKNLALYMHKEIVRRIEDKPEMNGFVFWNTFGGLDYIVTDYRRAMGAENVSIIQ